jgi:hypothetical protein
MRFGAATRIFASQIGEVELIDHFNHEARKVIFIEPILYRRGQ